MKLKKFLWICTAIVTLAALSGCNLPAKSQVNITLSSPESGQSVILGEEVRVVSVASARRGIESVELYINGALLSTDAPPEGQPEEYTSDQPWTPAETGNVVISVLARDAKGNPSDPVSIAIQVVQSLSEVNETVTPTPTVTPEGLVETQTAQAGCTNDATFVQDITIPVNSILTGGSNFTKIWRINNGGTCGWVSYELVHASGDLLSGSSPQALPLVSSGSNADLSLDLTAPSTPGTYSASWRIRAADGSVFGPELSLTIIVPQPATSTPEATATSAPTATPTTAPTATPTSAPLTVEQVFEQISLSAGAGENKTVTCPAGSVVVSGGYAANDGIRVWHMTKDGNGWRIYAANNTASSKLLNIYATCLHNSGGTTDIELVQQNANANSITHLVATCPAGSVATGGAWVIGTDTNIQIYNSSPSGNGWQIYVNNTGPNTPLINAYAICLSGVSGSTSLASNMGGVIPANGNGNLAAECPSDAVVTGGGFAINTGATVYNTTLSGNGWINYARNATATQKLMNSYAVCYTP